MPLIVADLVGCPDALLVYRAITARGRKIDNECTHLPSTFHKKSLAVTFLKMFELAGAWVAHSRRMARSSWPFAATPN
jgi:hypothetical protein